jgi:hypothetical protein
VLMEHLSYKVSNLTLHSEASNDSSLQASIMLQGSVSVLLLATLPKSILLRLCPERPLSDKSALS